MKKCLAIIFTLVSVSLVSAQTPEIGSPDSSVAGGLPQQALREVSIDKFEQEGYWNVYISTDSGFSMGKLFNGGPLAKQPIPGEEALNLNDDKVYGVRVDFLRRGHSSIYINSVRPIPVEGISKTISVWIAGRNYNHRLSLLITDSRGRYFELYMGRLNFQGWKKMSVSIPPQQANGDNGIIQNDYHYSSNGGVNVIGFRIDVDPMEAYGSYYVYLDDLRAITDLFAEGNRDPDDPKDDW
ncbi:MAG: flagellar filament outer layer protein FlaA [Spirochaetaceae bacterium]|jgi:hypothetical protein|nr:flagellar filament outer layer protein FlaA [Spirochaetaceae bacterium]